MKARAIFKTAVMIGPDEWSMKFVTREINLPDDFLADGHFVGLSFDNQDNDDTEGVEE